MQVILAQSAFKPTHANLTFVNDGPETALLAKPRIGFNRGGEIDGDHFEFSTAAPYTGNAWFAGGKREYAPEELLAVEPGFSQPVSVVALEDYYRLPQGAFRVRYFDGEHTSNWVEFTR